MFRRPNGEVVNVDQIAELIVSTICKDLTKEYTITVGTDSQNFDKTKIVEAITLHTVGRGGIFFYRVEYLPRISNLRQKIQEETNRSILITNDLVNKIELLFIERDIDIKDLNLQFQVHCDIGNVGKTKELIKEIVGWVTSYGYSCAIKPNSYTASGVANKFSK